MEVLVVFAVKAGGLVEFPKYRSPQIRTGIP
jgi:hypothetical protein